MGLDDEAPAQRLAAPLQAMGRTLALPRVLDRLGSMDFLSWRPEDRLFPGLFGTSHPEPTGDPVTRSEEHTSELQSLMRISYAVFCLKKKRRQHQRSKTYIGASTLVTHRDEHTKRDTTC